MTEGRFRIAVLSVALTFAALFAMVVLPPLFADGDVIGAFAAGFVNPYAAGYSSDVIACWVLLAIWVFHEARTRSVRHGWLCLVIGVVPGVAVGLGAYLFIRSKQLGHLAG